MLSACSGANDGASSMMTRPAARSRYSVSFGSSARQSDACDAAMMSAVVFGFGGVSAADAELHVSAASISATRARWERGFGARMVTSSKEKRTIARLARRRQGLAESARENDFGAPRLSAPSQR